jgi:hypothetical protein
MLHRIHVDAKMKITSATCRCGSVELRIAGEPILHGICYCASCQAAGRLHHAIAGADAIVAADSGTDFVLYRKDRVSCVKGGDQLWERRLKPDSPTRRMFARCCNTAMFLDFTKGHWLTVYRGRLPGDIPPATIRMMTADLPEGTVLPNDGLTNASGYSGKSMLKMLGAWMAMGFRRPPVDGLPL